LYSTHYDKFDAFKKSIDTCIADLGTRFKANMKTGVDLFVTYKTTPYMPAILLS